MGDPRGIFLLNSDRTLMPLSEEQYETEDFLQSLLQDHPELLAGDQIDDSEPRRWLLVAREVAIAGDEAGVGFVDHVFLDQDGVITFVEVKRSTDTRIRREVVGQLLDYASHAVVHWSKDTVRQRVLQTTGGEAELEQALASLIPHDFDEERFWEQVEINLRAKRVRMLFVADLIPPALRRIVEFMNETMDPVDVLAVEIRQYVSEDKSVRSLVPRLIGRTAVADRKVVQSTEKWTQDRFWEALAARTTPEGAAVAHALFDWAMQRKPRIDTGSGTRDGSLIPVWGPPGSGVYPFILWTNGYIELQFQWLRRRPPFDQVGMRLELLRRVNELIPVPIGEDRIDRRPGIKYELLVDDAKRARFLETMQWVLDECRAAGTIDGSHPPI